MEIFRTRAPSGEIHAEEEDVAPAAVRKIHPHWSGFMKERIESGCFLEQCGYNAQWMVGWMPGPEHPLVSPTARTLART